MTEKKKRIKRLNASRLNALIDETTEERFEPHKAQKYVPLTEEEKTQDELFEIANQYYKGTESGKTQMYKKEIKKDNKLIMKIILSGVVTLGIVIGVLILTHG